MAMNKLVAILIVLIIIVLLFFGVRWILQPGLVSYSDNPKDWLDRTTRGVTVDVEEATRGKGEYNIANQQLLLPGGEPTAFAYEGIYNGNFFATSYSDPSGTPVMEISPDLNPNDGILQGFIVERTKNGMLETHIFIDEDWRNTLNEINIVWGAKYDQQRRFAFTLVQPGIYHDVILDDMARMQPGNSFGGVQVGNMPSGGINPMQAEGIIMMAIH